jgi:hypothetical protein
MGIYTYINEQDRINMRKVKDFARILSLAHNFALIWNKQK